MLTKLNIKNLKRFDDVEIDLGQRVVFIGPNNSGKTTALQALALWDIGLRKWNEKQKSGSGRRRGVSINRKDLITLPVPSAKFLWRDLHVRRSTGKQKTGNIRIDITLEGITGGKSWKCGFEFDYANEESLYCRPLRLSEEKNSKRMKVPRKASGIKIAFLPPMSGLATEEPKWEPGRIGVLIGEGQTAQVLRNTCYQLYEFSENDKWNELVNNIYSLFGETILPPEYIVERGEIIMEYKTHEGVQLGISSSGKGLQQTLMLLAYLYLNPGAVLLLDEPDAHLEILRQRQVYSLISNIAQKQGSQVIAASHSEVILNEAAGKDTVIAFIGKPHRIDNRGSQLLKSLREIGFDQYIQAEQKGWVLYLEGSTDLEILKTFARKLNHPAAGILDSAFVYYVQQPKKAREHFYGLKEAYHKLRGIAIFDRTDRELRREEDLNEMMWSKREIENYVCMEEVLIEYATNQSLELFNWKEPDIMKETIKEISSALKTLGKPGPWSPDIKASDDFLDPLFTKYFSKLGLPNLMMKSSYYVLAELVPKKKIDPEVIKKLDAVVRVAK